MKASIVIGANYGDEGKGTVVAHLTKGNTNVLNVLTNGGSQRGHSILTKDGSMTFQHFGSGTYYGADNYYSAWYILNPMQFVKEYCELVVKPKHIYRDRRCRWSTPYDAMANLIDEEARGRHASCGMGIWMTIRRCDRMPIMLFDDFVKNEDKQYPYLESVKAYYETFIEIPQKWKDTWNSDTLKAHFIRDCKIMHTLTKTADIATMKWYNDVIFENGQGLLLCDTGKDTEDTTPSNTGILYALSMAKQMGIDDVTAHYVTRPYLTRHGDGNIDNAISRHDLSSDIIEDRTNHFNEHQGMFRYGELDIVDLRKRIVDDSKGVNFVLDITHCDEMDRVSEFKKEFFDIKTYDNPLV